MAASEARPSDPTVPQIFALAQAIAPRYRPLVLLATFTSCATDNWSHSAKTRRPRYQELRVEATLTEMQNGKLAFDPPKSNAGNRTVGYPELIGPTSRHLSGFASGRWTGGYSPAHRTPPRRSNFRRSDLEAGTQERRGRHRCICTICAIRGIRWSAMRGDPEGAHGAHRSLQHQGRDDLPARHR